MNVLFIEDEKILSAGSASNGSARVSGDTRIYLAKARELLQSEQKFHMVIADHRLPDGLGMQFVMAMKEQYPMVQFVVVSACLSDEDFEKLEEVQIPRIRCLCSTAR